MTEVVTITLVEFQTHALDAEKLPEREAHHIHIQFGDKVTVEWPTPKTNNLWQLTSKGWVGYIPLGKYGGISLKPKVPLANLFGMLEYAYDLRSFRLLEGLYDMESIKDFYERLAAILAERVLKRVREGLYRTYIEEYASDSFVRGRIDIASLCRTPVKSKIACYSENHTIDIEDNQIVAWTLHNIARSGLISREKPSKLVQKADRTFRHVINLNFFSSLDCINRTYNRLNADYDVLHKMCRFFLENTGPTLDAGDRSMIPFLIDMSRLFELFVARWLEEQIDSKFTLRRQESLCIGNQGALRMQMDILICDTEGCRFTRTN